MADGLDIGIDGLGRFSVIGSGGFSTVYSAWDDGFEREVAVKVLHSLDEAGLRRFERERSIMGRLSAHPNVITPFQWGYTASGSPYLVMEYVSGGSLEALITRNGPLAWMQAIDIVLPICAALRHAHQHKVLHRDVKPDNILLAPEAPKLTDFGIAAIREATATQLAFTLAHSPPETFAGGVDRRDERSDLYSLASTLYTLIAGAPPYGVEQQDSQAAYMVRIADLPLPDLTDELVPPALDEFLQRAMAKDSAVRPQTAAAFASALQQIQALDASSPARPTRHAQAATPPGGETAETAEPAVPATTATSAPAAGHDSYQERASDRGDLAVRTTQSVDASTGPSGSSRRILWLLLALVVAGGVVVGAVYLSNGRSTDPADGIDVAGGAGRDDGSATTTVGGRTNATDTPPSDETGPSDSSAATDSGADGSTVSVTPLCVQPGGRVEVVYELSERDIQIYDKAALMPLTALNDEIGRYPTQQLAELSGQVVLPAPDETGEYEVRVIRQQNHIALSEPITVASAC